MEDNKVSIMMPVYNGLPLIKASIASLLQQTYSNWECIIVDDGSTDGTSSYIDSLTDSRIRVHHFSHNQGRPIARQKALDMANGDFLAMLDAGDLYHPNKLKAQIDAFEKHPAVVLVSSCMCSFGLNTEKLYGRGCASDEEVVFNGMNVPLHGPSMIRMVVAKNVQYNPNLKLGQDSDYLRKVLSNGKHFFVLKEYLYYYSELDSVSKRKIKKAHKINAVQHFKNHEYKLFVIRSLKFVYSIVVYPFMSIDTIISKRGTLLTEIEKKTFKTLIKPLVDNSINEINRY